MSEALVMVLSLAAVAVIMTVVMLEADPDPPHWLRCRWLDETGQPSSNRHVNRVCAVCRKVDLGGDRRATALAHLQATRPKPPSTPTTPTTPARGRRLAVVPPKGERS